MKLYKDFINTNIWKFIFYIIVTVTHSICPIVLSFQISNTINHMGLYEKVIHDTTMIIGVLLLFLVSNYFQNYLAAYLTEKFQNQLLLDIYKTSMKNKFENTNASYSQKMINESSNLAQYYIVSYINFITSIISMIIALVSLLYVNALVTVLLVLGILGYQMIVLKTNHLIYERQKNVIDLQSQYFGKCQEIINSIEQIKCYGIYSKTIQSLSLLGMKYIKSFLHKLDIQIVQSVILQLFRYVFIILYVLIVLTQSNNQGEIMFVIAMIEPFFSSCKQMLQFIQNKQSIKVSFENLKILNFVDKPMIKQNIISDIHSIKLSNLKADKQKCRAIDYEFTKGKTYCITGENGIGKTTLFNVLSGFETQYTGEVSVNNYPIQTINLNSLYNKHLFFMDQTADVLEYIDVIDGTISLSRGERQQILLNEIDENIENALILLDEPTASLDVNQKDYLISKIAKLSKNNIILMITHDDYILNQNYERLELVA